MFPTSKNQTKWKKVQKKSVVQENIDQNENILEQSEHPNENSVTQNNTRTSENTQFEENIFDDETNVNVRKDLTKKTVDNWWDRWKCQKRFDKKHCW